MQRKNSAFRLRKRHLAYILGAIFAVLAFVFIYRSMRKWELASGRLPAAAYSSKDNYPGFENEDPYADDERPQTYYEGDLYTLKDNVETVLFIGIDKFESELNREDAYRNTQQSDFLMLLVLDHDAESCTALHINRDIMGEIRVLDFKGDPVDSYVGQLALSHTYGSGGMDSCKNTVWSVSKLLYGARIDHYVAFTMDAVPELNDAVGGVTVTVKDDFSAVDPSLVLGETVTLTGEQALNYIRVRRDVADSSNLSRMERQRDFLSAFYNEIKARRENDESLPADIVLTLSKYMTSDCTVNELSDIADSIADYSLDRVEDIRGEAVRGEKFMEYYVDETALTEQILDLLYEKEE